MNKKEEIGSLIKQKRLASNLRMDDVCNSLGISRATLSYIENGKGNYSIENLLEVIDFLNISLKMTSNSSNKNRDRATRKNTILDKKKNRFVIMCIEQYIKTSNKNPKNIYNSMKKKGILNDLINDYEDLHGMSTEYINDYIDQILRGTV